MRAAIHLPVVERLRVLNYPLYPGANKQGLDLHFDRGVTVIAGINGIGKTTLLNLLLRMLVGSTGPSKAATRDIGRVSKRSLVTAKKFSFFQDRAGVTLGANATSTLTFRIGGKQIAVTRHLTNLEITKLVISGKTLATPSNSEFLAQMVALSGLATPYDFHMVVRYVQFFTEERLPLLWSPTAQLELFKMLFVDEAIGQKLNKLFSEIQGADTDYRNRTYQYNQRKERYDQARAKYQSADPDLTVVTAQLAATRTELDSASRDHRRVTEQVAELVKQRDDADRKVESLQVALDQEIHAFHQQDAAYIAQALPALDDKFRMLMQGLGSNLGCFVCGKSGKREVATISKRLRDRHCFVCNASLARSSTSNVTPITARALQKIEDRIDALRAEIAKHLNAQQQREEAYSNALALVRPVVTRRHELMMRVEQLEAQIPKSSHVVQATLIADLEVERIELDQLAEKRKEFSVQYKRQIDKLVVEMGEIESDLGSRLTSYAEAFLRNASTPLRQSVHKLAVIRSP